MTFTDAELTEIVNAPVGTGHERSLAAALLEARRDAGRWQELTMLISSRNWSLTVHYPREEARDICGGIDLTTAIDAAIAEGKA